MSTNPAIELPQEPPKKAATRAQLLSWERLSASAVQAAAFTPMIASVLWLGAVRVRSVADGVWVEVSSDGKPVEPPWWMIREEQAMVTGLFYLGLAMVAITLVVYFGRLATLKRANSTSYYLIRSRRDELECKLDRTQAISDPVAGQEAKSHLRAIDAELAREGPQWVSGDGYMNVWRRLHRSEEALIRIERDDDAYAHAVLARLAVANSKMENADEIERELTEVFERMKPSQGETTAEREGDAYKARALLSQVWREIHEYRDNRWDSLRKKRNQLLTLVCLSGVGVYILLVLAVIMGASGQSLRWAAVVYLVGVNSSLLGLLARGQKQTAALADDYGLTVATILTALQMAGVSAVFAVVWLGATGASMSITSGQGITDDLFNLLQHPANLVTAAAFGLAPNMLIDKFTEGANKAAEQLVAASSTEGRSTRNRGGKNDGSE